MLAIAWERNFSYYEGLPAYGTQERKIEVFKLGGMEVTGIVIVPILEWMVLDMECLGKVLDEAVHVFPLLSRLIICIHLIELGNEHETVDVYHQQYEREKVFQAPQI